MTQLNIQGSSWQQPEPACSGAMKYLWFWSWHCLGFYSLSPASFSLAASSSRQGVWWGKTIPVSSSNSPCPQLSVCCHTAVPHTQAGAQYTSVHHGQRGGRELPAKPLTPTPILTIKRLEHCVTVC